MSKRCTRCTKRYCCAAAQPRTLRGMANGATWKKRVAAWRASGLTAPEFCEGRDFAVGTLRWWACRLDRAARAGATAAPAGEMRLVRVVRATPAAMTPSGSGVSIAVAGVRIAVEAGFDAATLVAVLEVVAQREVRR